MNSVSDSDSEAPKITSTQRIQQPNQDQSYNAISLDSSPIQEISVEKIRPMSVSSMEKMVQNIEKRYDALDNILENDDSDDDDIVVKPSELPKSKLFVPSDSSYSRINTPKKNNGSTSSSQSKRQLSSQPKEPVMVISSSSQPAKTTPKPIKLPINRSGSEITSSSTKRKQPISTDKYLDSDSDNERSLNPIHQLRRKEKVFLSSTPEKIDPGSSSIGDIRISTHASKPLFPIHKIQNGKDIELSDSDEEIEKTISKNSSSNAFLDKLTKHTHKNDQRLERVKARQLLESTKSEMSFLADILSPAPSPKPATRSYSETALPEHVESVAERPAKRGKTTSNPRKSKEERELEKQRQLQEKQNRQLYQDANRVNRKKDDLLTEMIIKIPQQVIRDFKGNDHTLELAPIEIQEVSNPENIICWSRKTRAIYDSETDSFKPSPLQILDEKICVFVYTASEFLQMLEMETLVTKFNEVILRNKNFNNFIILINGYDQILQKLKTQENRKYTAKVRSRMEPVPTAPMEDENSGVANADEFEPGKRSRGGRGGRRRKTKAAPRSNTISSYSSDQIEAEVAQLQVNGFKVFPTKTTHETLLWLKSFTYTISSARYDKVERNPDLANIGTIKSGVNTHDTYLKMLLQFKFMTEVKANRIIDELPTLLHLYNAVNQNRLPTGPDGKPLMMSNIQSSIMKLFSTMNDSELLER